MTTRIAIISDVHANLEALEAALEDIAANNVGTILCLGDMVGYNANPGECIDLLRKHDVLCVAGNHDRAVTQQITTDGFGYTAERAIPWTRRQLDADALAYLSALPVCLTIPHTLIAVHGALHPEIGKESVRLDSDERRRLSFQALSAHPSGVRICAFGHTHQAGVFELRDDHVRKLAGERFHLRPDGLYLINPGTIGHPRDSDRRATYLILDPAEMNLSIRRIAYDARIPLAKSQGAGLAPLWSTFPPLAVNIAMRLPKPLRRSLRRGLEALMLIFRKFRPVSGAPSNDAHGV